MTPAQTILKMIEEVDPGDIAAMEEIDARVYCLNNKITLEELEKKERIHVQHFLPAAKKDWKALPVIWDFTRSRDALKAIRPEGWQLNNLDSYGPKEWSAMIFLDRGDGQKSVIKKSCILPTEEFAELHAIVQAVEYERRSAALDELTAIAQATGQYDCPLPGHQMHEGNCVTCYMEAKDAP